MITEYFIHYLKKQIIILFVLISGIVFSQTNPALEMASGASNPTGNGPITTTSINFQTNINNPSGNTFNATSPTLTATYSISNSRYTTSINNSTTNIGLDLGGSASIFPTMNTHGLPIDANFTSSGPITSGTGISVTSNNSVRMNVMTYPLRVNTKATNGTHAMADLTISFNRPINDPILHIAGLGAVAASGLGYAARLDLISSNVALANLSLTRLSGNSTTGFQTSGFGIFNGSTTINGTGINSGSGSVRVNGTGITSLTFTISIRGDGTFATTSSWANTNTDTSSGDSFTLGISTLESNLAITKTVSNTTPNVGSNVTFNLTATNNGPSNNTNVIVNDLLPSGYTFVSATPSLGTYNNSTGVWAIGNLNNNGSATLSIVASVNSSGEYINTANINGDISDPVVSNNNTSVYVIPQKDQDGDGVNSTNDLDDDNDGILDASEKGSCGVTGSIMSTTGYRGFVYDAFPEIDTWAEINSSTTFPTNSFRQVATFDYNEYANTQNAFNIDYNVSANLSGTNPDMANYQGNVIGSPIREFAVVFTKVINEDEIGTFQYKLNSGDNHIIIYKNGTKIASVQNAYAGTLPINNFATISVVRGDRIEVVLVEEDAGNTYVNFSVTKTIGQCMKDTDGDGTPDHLDLDSDGDGCPDAIEGGDNITIGMLDSNNRINVAANGTTTPVVVDAQGVPVITNTPSAFNVDGQAQGQTIGQSQIVNPAAVAGTATANQTIASGATPTALTLSGYTGTIQWQSSSDNITFTNISGATSASFSPGALSANTYYRAIVSSAGGCTVIGNTIMITIVPNTDTDGDGIVDYFDLDDDNDGILDTIECPVIYFGLSNLQLLTGSVGSSTSFVAGTKLIKTNALSYLNNQYDAIVTIISKNTGSGEFSLTASGGNLALRNTIPNTNPYGEFKIEFVPTGTVTNASTTFTPTTIPYLTLQFNDIDGNNNNASTELIGYKVSTLPNSLTIGSELENLGFLAGGPSPTTSYSYYRHKNLSLGTSIPNDNTNSEGFKIYFNYNSYSSAAFVFGLTGSGTTALSERAASINEKTEYACDSDLDGIPNHLDTDSDGDGCSDAAEGDENVLYQSISSGRITGTVDANGVPIIVNNSGIADIGGDQGQGLGNAQTISVVDCKCNLPASSGTTSETKHGITALGRAGADNGNWPMNQNGGWTAIEAKTKGFVINRLTTTEINTLNATPANLRVGMMVYNTSLDCLYINIDGTATGWKCFNTQTCPVNF